MNRYEIKENERYKAIGQWLIENKDDLAELRDSTCRIAYLESQQEKTRARGTQLIFGECKQVPDNMQWICPYDMLITIYQQNITHFTDEQLEILIWHELKHIGINADADDEEYFVVPHDYEEFKEIIDQHGLDWAVK